MPFRRVLTTPNGPSHATEDILGWGPQGDHKELLRIQLSERPAGDHVWAIVSFGPGAEVPMHIRPTESNYILLLEGEIELLLPNDKSVRLRPRDCLVIQKNTRHGWRTVSAGPAVVASVRFTDTSDPATV